MNFYNTALKQKKTIILIITFTVLLSLIFSLIQPLKYSSTVKILIIQKSSFSLDAYSALRSAERMGENLSQIVYTSSFFDKIMHSGFNIDNSYFPQDELKKRNFWKKTVTAQIISGSGILEIKAFHPNKNQANQIAQAVSFVLTTQVNEYFNSDSLTVKMIDSPIESKWPVQPNILLNTIIALFLGIILSCGYVIFKYPKDQNPPYPPLEKDEDRLSPPDKGDLGGLNQIPKLEMGIVDDYPYQA